MSNIDPRKGPPKISAVPPIHSGMSHKVVAEHGVTATVVGMSRTESAEFLGAPTARSGGGAEPCTDKPPTK